MIQLRLKYHQMRALEAAIRSAILDANESIRCSMENECSKRPGRAMRGQGSHVSRMKSLIIRWRLLLFDIKRAEAAEKGATG